MDDLAAAAVWLIMFVLMVLPGTPGPNRFGPDPLDPDGEIELGEVFR